jgi:thymidylate synthase (FAD)
VGFTENEVSRRYVDDPPTFYTPRWRERADNKKQGSGDVLPASKAYICDDVFFQAIRACNNAYIELLSEGVAPEQARTVLPQSMMTEWYWTGSLAAYARFCNLRMAEDAQKEIQQLAAAVYEIVERLFPVSMEVLCDKGKATEDS